MTRVICIKCGNIQDSYAKWFFKCNKCDYKQIIENSLYESDNKNNIKMEEQEKPNGKKQEAKEEELEVEKAQEDEENEDDSSGEKEGKPKQEKIENGEVFKCPNCDQPLNKGQTPCPSCDFEIEWSE